MPYSGWSLIWKTWKSGKSQGILFWRKMSGKSQGISEKSEMSGKSQGILSNHTLQNFIKALCFWMKFHVNKWKIFRSRLRRSRPPTTIIFLYIHYACTFDWRSVTSY